MTALWNCWPIRAARGAVKKIAHRSWRRSIGHGHSIRHAGRIGTTAKVTWVCVAVGGGASLGAFAWPPATGYAPPAVPSGYGESGESFATYGLLGYATPGEFDAAFAPVPDCCAPGPLWPPPEGAFPPVLPETQFPSGPPPEQPRQPNQPIPEPGSGALLATGVIAAFLWGKRA